MLLLSFTLIKPALYSVHNAAQTKIAELKIHPDGHTITTTRGRRLRKIERQSIEAFEAVGRK